MKLFTADSWLKAPLDRDVIARWTVGGTDASHALELPPPPDPAAFEFLALGDTGDSEAAGMRQSPQDAVAREMAQDSMLSGGKGKGLLTLHMGDVVYMTGERRLYERNFRRPYSAFLTPESTVDSLTFTLPFLPVPGNHDYYDLGGWAKWLTRIPFLKVGVRAAMHQLFAFGLPEGGSDMGRAYMRAFVDSHADTSVHPLPYRPAEQTKLPNRYYRFTFGSVDFFALDSNTLEAPAPWKDVNQVRADAASHIEVLEAREEALDKLLSRTQKALDKWRETARELTVQDGEQQQEITETDAQIAATLAELETAMKEIHPAPMPFQQVLQTVLTAQRRWKEAQSAWDKAKNASDRLEALETLETASDEGCSALSAVEGYLGVLPESPEKTRLQAQRDRLQQLLNQWTQRITQTPADLAENLQRLSEEALDVQRDLEVEKLRLHYLPVDYDRAQLDWLDRSLAEAMKERPDNWRVVYLHHPLYTTATNHCEASDVRGLRENLLPLLQERVHLVLSGHAHAFEWFRSDRLPHTGIFVTGGGGQVSLRPSLLASHRFGKRRERYESLRQSGVQECAMAGKGPDAADGEEGLLYHYLRIQVTPDALLVRPVGVRRLDPGYRRETPMPVFHADSLPPRYPSWTPRLLEGVEIRRGQPPRPLWK